MFGKILLERYKVFSFGKGGMGFHMGLKDIHTGESFFAKTYQDQSESLGSLKERFEEELNFSVKLGTHPNVHAPRFVEEIDGKLYLFSDFIPRTLEGNTLTDRIRSGLSFEKAINYAYQICLGMEFLNTPSPIAHLDLKPSNLLIDPNGILKITDYGLSRTTSPFRDDHRAEASGTILYKSPEQLLNEIIDARTDIFSFAIIFYEMLTRELPYANNILEAKGPKQVQLLREYLLQEEMGKNHYRGLIPWHDKIRPLEDGSSIDHDVRDKLNTLIGACFDFHREKRFQSFRILRETLAYAFPQYCQLDYATDAVPRNPLLLGMDFQKMGNQRMALKFFNKALKEDKNNGSAWYHAALSYFELGKSGQGRSCLDRALDLGEEEEKCEELLHKYERMS